ncbi:uncharacterized protein LOC129250960 [Anastrepha obliqua]|uniref:uncharacterized protein LOC129250960 n=1 Tax=Anastrepha obliqua TaxID=95512 RepID=UPI0024099462|nr:uncharacterized protein LOC129250960 [Anastrepha obliqua]
MHPKITTIQQIITYKDKKKKMYNTSPLTQYNHYKHRCRIKNAKKLIDNSAPALHLTNINNAKNNYTDLASLFQVMHSNTEMLKYFGRMYMLGRKNSWNDSHDAQWRYSRLAFMQRSVKAIAKENKHIARRVLSARRVVNTNLKRSSLSYADFRAPREILSKYSTKLILPPRCWEQRLLLRPIVYFELEVPGLYYIGRFTVQLYTEAFPQAVLAFVRICKYQKLNKLKLIRTFPKLWSEFELSMDQADAAFAKSSPIEYDRRALGQNFKPGILSFSLKHIETLQKGILSFALSFRPLSVEMTNRVAFGVLIAGMRGLQLLENNSTKNGKPIKDVITTAMGIKTPI